MLSWIALAASILVTLPIRIELSADIGEKSSFHAFIFIYGFRLQYEGRIDKLGSAFFRGGSNKLLEKIQIFKIFTLLKNMVTHAISKRLYVSCRIGTGDAFSTVMATGLARSLCGAVFRQWAYAVDIQPSFQQPCFILHAHCILCYRGGDIILAGIQALNAHMPTILKGWNIHGQATN